MSRTTAATRGVYEKYAHLTGRGDLVVHPDGKYVILIHQSSRHTLTHSLNGFCAMILTRHVCAWSKVIDCRWA
jgi:hypothetical protein